MSLPGHAHENWSGSMRFRASRLAQPKSEAEVVQLVRHVRDQGRRLRPVGSSHSASRLYATDDTLVSLSALDGVVAVEGHEAVVQPGAVLKHAFAQLRQRGLSPHDMGDISGQTLAGSLSTGTHGSGKTLQNLSSMLVGGRLVDGRGEVVEFGEGAPDVLRALQVSLGACGIFTELRVRLQPAYRLRRTEWCASVTDTLSHLEELLEQNRKVDFYWYPRSDEVKLRLLSPPSAQQPRLGWARLLETAEDWADQVIPKHADISNRFDEMEYALAAREGAACFLEIREAILTRHRARLGWRVLFRYVAADEAFLSTAQGRDAVEISIHQNAGLPHAAIFDDLEPIFWSFGGRPHWAKKHRLDAGALAPLYPCWSPFAQVRRRFDPDGVFSSPYLTTLLGDGA